MVVHKQPLARNWYLEQNIRSHKSFLRVYIENFFSILRSVDRIFYFAIDVGFHSNEPSLQKRNQNEAISMKKQENNRKSDEHLNIQEMGNNFPSTESRRILTYNETSSRNKKDHYIAKDFLMEDGEWLETRIKFFSK